MAFCTQCGQPLTPGLKFCTKCGKKVPEKMVTPPAAPPVCPPAAPKAPEAAMQTPPPFVPQAPQAAMQAPPPFVPQPPQAAMQAPPPFVPLQPQAAMQTPPPFMPQAARAASAYNSLARVFDIPASNQPGSWMASCWNMPALRPASPTSLLTSIKNFFTPTNKLAYAWFLLPVLTTAFTIILYFFRLISKIFS